MGKPAKKPNQRKAVWLVLLGLACLCAVVALLLRDKDMILLNPKGFIADEQLRLLITSTLVMLEIAIPVLFLVYYFAWKYREDNHKASYNPHAGGGKLFAVAIWAFPTITALLIAMLLLPATQKLQPQKLIDPAIEPLRIQVVAMRWKWLFIYPEQKVATVNYVHLPVNRPVQFELTADETPMSSFWIPHLGGQLYAMTEHVNRLNLVAGTTGDFEGSTAEINGHGFAGMRFKTRVTSEEDFSRWVDETVLSPVTLNDAEYEKLLEPSEYHPVNFYANPDPAIYGTILSKYASSGGGAHGSHTGGTEAGGH